MRKIAPPPFREVALGDDDRVRRLRLRLFQVSLTLITLVVTGWICTFGWIPAIFALMTAKHVLVAILVMGLGVDATERMNESAS